MAHLQDCLRTAEGHEVDFLARYPDGQSELIQVCADASSGETAARVTRALVGARGMFPDATPRLLVATQAALPSSVPPGVTAEPAWAWILRPAAGSTSGR